MGNLSAKQTTFCLVIATLLMNFSKATITRITQESEQCIHIFKGICYVVLSEIISCTSRNRHSFLYTICIHLFKIWNEWCWHSFKLAINKMVHMTQYLLHGTAIVLSFPCQCHTKAHQSPQAQDCSSCYGCSLQSIWNRKTS